MEQSELASIMDNETHQIRIDQAIDETISAAGDLALNSSTNRNTSSEHPGRLNRYPSTNVPAFDPNEVTETPVPARFARWKVPMKHWDDLQPHSIHKLKASDIVPPKDVPFHEQVEAYVQRWSLWLAEVQEDARRKELTSFAMAAMEGAWRYGIDQGLYPRGGPGDWVYAKGCPTCGNPGSPGTYSAIPISRSESEWGTHGAADAPSARTREGGTAQNGEKRVRKPKPTPDEQIFVEDGIVGSSQMKNPKIKLVELTAAGTSIEAIRARAESPDMEKYEALLEAATERLGHSIQERDWRTWWTDENPLGRDLRLYALYQAEIAEIEIAKFEGLKARFNTKSQLGNNEQRLELAKRHREVFVALAVEVDERRSRSLLQKDDASKDDETDEDDPGPADRALSVSDKQADEPATGTVKQHEDHGLDIVQAVNKIPEQDQVAMVQDLPTVSLFERDPVAQDLALPMIGLVERISVEPGSVAVRSDAPTLGQPTYDMVKGRILSSRYAISSSGEKYETAPASKEIASQIRRSNYAEPISEPPAPRPRECRKRKRHSSDSDDNFGDQKMSNFDEGAPVTSASRRLKLTVRQDATLMAPNGSTDPKRGASKGPGGKVRKSPLRRISTRLRAKPRTNYSSMTADFEEAVAEGIY